MTSGITGGQTSTSPTCYLPQKTDGPTFNTRSQTHQNLSLDTSISQPDVASEVSEATDPTTKSPTAERLQALLQMQENQSLLQTNIQMLI